MIHDILLDFKIIKSNYIKHLMIHLFFNVNKINIKYINYLISVFKLSLAIS